MPFSTYTRADLRLRLQERWDATPFWDDDDANRALNATLRTWNALTGYWRQRLTLNTVPNDPLLPIPGTLVQQTAIGLDGAPLVGVSLAEFNLMVPNWWYLRGTPEIWAPVGLNLIAWSPVPTTIQTVTIDGVRQTPVLTTDLDTVDIGSEELSTLLGYALHAAAVKGGIHIVQRTLPQYKAFMAAAASRNRFLKATRWYSRFNTQPYAWARAASVPVVGAPSAAPLPGEG